MFKSLPLTYTRPKHVEQHELQRTESLPSSSEKTDGSVKSGKSGYSSGIPESLGFDRIINGGTCPPMTVRDFMNYLIYVEHAAENLQFFLWYRDYEKRFKTANSADLALAPEWTQAMEDETIAKIRKDNLGQRRREPAAAEMFKGTDFEKPAREPLADTGNSNPFITPPTSSSGYEEGSLYSGQNHSPSTYTSSYKTQAAEAFQAAGAKQPFTIQPFREEINRVISTYIMEGSPRQLNLSAWEQRAAVQAISYTTHPSAFRTLVRTVETALRRQAHPNFVRWSICNGNPARVFFARSLGVGLIIAGFAVALVLTLSTVGRGYRALAAIAWVLGISTLVAAYKGMCVVLHGMHHRHMRPWELFVQDNDYEEDNKRSFDSFGSNNSYEDEPWVVKYEKRNVVRKVFDREIWIQEPALRQIQDTIFIQAMLAALLLAGVLTAIFVAVPGGNYF
ncbi:hypothetical protein S7711_00545 [Stachybotrys chartarum IBT 7711]|uniref:RGS domain-containing protein n=1 Tax=Stachybotrys chartarum (strain CBS 109288 / IBT 7711) TaxID=1280523 RepID=A0A084ATP0_STACB|nr:hypothetical protein S7711_00545 [Stachybotrys chartarum IBT 7711]KFA49720.1 hypothetical protein S40293_01363 [Stachybotrys chartarum IBT 40293]